MEFFGVPERIEGSSPTFAGGAFEGVWGPVVRRGGTLYVQVLLFAVDEAGTPAGSGLPDIRLQFRHDGAWRDCAWLGTGGASPDQARLTVWTQWEAVGEADGYRLVVS